MKKLFSNFYFSSYGHILHKNINFRWIFTITRKKNLKVDFSFDSAQCVSFIKTGTKLRGGDGLHILSWEIPNGQDLKTVNKSLITRKIEIGKLTFYFYSVHCASFSKMGSKLRGGGRGVPGGVCIFLVWTGPRGSYISELHLDWSNWTLKGFFLVNVLMTCSVAHKCSKTLRYHYHS